MPEHLKGRQNPVPERPEGESEADLASLVQAFGEGWLAKQQDHPLQRLWTRADTLATSQLLTLGEAVRTLGPLFPSWVRHQVRAIKGDRGERRGAVVELLVLHAIRSAGLNARPTAKNFPGYDLSVEYPGASLDISIKNFGMSEHEAAAKRSWNDLLQEYQRVRGSGLQRAAGLFIEARRYPNVEDWKQLTQAMSAVVSAPWDGRIAIAELGNCWRIAQHPLPTHLGTYAESKASYQLITSIPHHQNEHANLISYLEKASHNARKHARTTDNLARALFIRLREATDFQTYRTWASDYLGQNPDGPLDAILLYQPTMAMTPESAHSLHHAFAAVLGQSYARWHGGYSDRRLGFSVPIGLTGGPSDRQIQLGQERIPIGAKYLFQRGELFMAYGMEGKVRLLAPGIHQHAVMSFGGEGESIILQGKFPPEEGLDLFD